MNKKQEVFHLVKLVKIFSTDTYEYPDEVSTKTEDLTNWSTVTSEELEALKAWIRVENGRLCRGISCERLALLRAAEVDVPKVMSYYIEEANKTAERERQRKEVLEERRRKTAETKAKKKRERDRKKYEELKKEFES